jgi:hypothetical protein
MSIIPEGGSVVVGVKAKVSLAPALFKMRSLGSMTTLAADTEVAKACGSSRSCTTAAAAIMRTRVCILGPTTNEIFRGQCRYTCSSDNGVIESQVSTPATSPAGAWAAQQWQ